jgi:hypothetical protein
MQMDDKTQLDRLEAAVRAAMAHDEPSARPFGPTSDSGVSCLYNGPNGTSCIVGHLFSPERRSKLTEGLAAGSEDMLAMPELREFKPELLRSVQWMHDGAAENWLQMTDHARSSTTWGAHLLAALKNRASGSLEALAARF